MDYNIKQYDYISDLFLQNYNELNNTDFNLYDVDDTGSDYDFRIINGSKEIIKVQVKDTFAGVGKEKINIEKFLRGEAVELPNEGFKLVHEHDRFKYTLNFATTGKNTGAYRDCILLIIYKQFPLGDNKDMYLDEMKRIARSYLGEILEIWVMNDIRNQGPHKDLCLKII